jgi:hypothetical protein
MVNARGQMGGRPIRWYRAPADWQLSKTGSIPIGRRLVPEAGKDRLVDVIVAEGRLIHPEAQAPQPDHNVHDGAHSALPNIIVRSGESVQKAPIRPPADWEPTLRSR